MSRLDTLGLILTLGYYRVLLYFYYTIQYLTFEITDHSRDSDTPSIRRLAQVASRTIQAKLVDHRQFSGAWPWSRNLELHLFVEGTSTYVNTYYDQ